MRIHLATLSLLSWTAAAGCNERALKPVSDDAGFVTRDWIGMRPHAPDRQGPDNYWDVWGSAPDSVYISGGNALILHSTDGGETWSQQEPPPSVGKATFSGVWGTSRTDLYIVGHCTRCSLHTTDGETWQGTELRGSSARCLVWAGRPGKAYSTGSTGMMVKEGDKDWRRLRTNAWPDWEFSHGIWGRNADDFFVVGFDGVIVHALDDGTTWKEQASPTATSLTGIWGTSGSEVYVAGVGGFILHTDDNGQTWTLQTSGTTQDLWAVWGSGPEDVYVVGSAGVILHTSDHGETWQQQDSGTDMTLGGIFGFSPTDIYIVSNGGIILRKRI